MLHVIATITLRPGRRAGFLKEFHLLVPQVRAEHGCLAYGPAIDAASGIAAQPPLRGDVVTVIEQWADLPALQAHLKAPHMGPYRERVKEMVADVSLQVLEPA